ncbi:MAG: hypothetical protein HZB15_00350, partial [Actinobacteria bacterium]|nr:hypothetical protein [Actinomycetota bacterium]
LVAWILGTQAHGDLLLFGTGGIAAGAVVAEMHHIRRAKGPRTARLDVRTVRHYLTDRDLHLMIGVAAVATATGIVGVWSDETRAATWWCLGAVASLGAAGFAQRRVATRARPAVSDKLTHADDLVRELAIGRGLARPATFVALAMVARACFDLEPTIDGVARLLGVCAWLYAAVLWWYNRRLGLDFLMAERGPLPA